MRELGKFENFMFQLGAVLMLLGLFLFMVDRVWCFLVYSVGVIPFCIMQVKAEYLGRDVQILRLRRQQLLACVLFALTSVCMGMQVFHTGFLYHNEWVISLTIASIIELYTTLRISAALQKSKKS